MNYILEIKAFYELLELNQLHTPAIALWHALMHMANKTGWQDNFTVAIPVLTIKTGLNKQAVLKARNELKEKGLIDFKSRNNQAASYLSLIHILLGIVEGKVSEKEQKKGGERKDEQLNNNQ